MRGRVASSGLPWRGGVGWALASPGGGSDRGLGVCLGEDGAPWNRS